MSTLSLPLAVGAIAALLIYLISIAIYRLTFHPLAKYPGPFLAKISGWYNAYHAWKKDRHLDQYRCHQKYGLIIRYAPDYIVINTADGAQTIYAGAKTNVRKAPFYKYLHHDNAAAVSTVIDKTAHARKRHIISQGFSDVALRSLEPYIITNIKQWCDLLGTNTTGDKKVEVNEWTEAKNMSQWSNYLTLDVLGDLCFGKPFGLLTSSAQRYIPKMMLSSMYALSTVGNSPLLPLWKPIFEKLGLPKLISAKVFSDVAIFKLVVQQAIQERMEKAKSEKAAGLAERKDFFYWLTNAKDSDGKPGYTMPELWLEARTLVAAGSDTSAITLAAAFFYLCHTPKVLTKLENEIRSTFDNFDSIRTGPKMNSCTYLRAVIDDTLRIAPPVLSSLPREVQDGGIIVSSQYFPKGTILGTSAYCLHHNADNFLDPFAYWPERWIVDEENGVKVEDVAAARMAFIPFSLGSRGCVGKPMAYAEISMALARVLWRFDVRLKEGDITGEGRHGEFALADVFVGERDGPWVEFRDIRLTCT